MREVSKESRFWFGSRIENTGRREWFGKWELGEQNKKEHMPRNGIAGSCSYSFFFFLRTARLFSKMAIPFYIITSNVRGFQFLHFLASVCVCVCVCAQAQLLSCVHSCIPWTVAHQAPLSMGFPRQEYWSGLPFPSPGDLPDPRIKLTLDWQVDSLPLSHLRSPIPYQYLTLSLFFF